MLKRGLESRLVRNSSRGQLVLRNNKVVYGNEAAHRMLNANERQLKGVDIMQILPESAFLNGGSGRTLATVTTGNSFVADYEFIQDGDRILVYLDDATEVAAYEDKLREDSIRDPMTGVFNRRFLEELLKQDREVAIRYTKQDVNEDYGHITQYGEDIGFIMIDLNYLKEVNDTKGHEVGDQLLKDVANLLRESTRKADLLTRYGGDEFLLMLPHTDGEVGIVMEKIRQKVDEWNAGHQDKPYQISLALGGSYWHSGKRISVADAIDEADSRMYKDKEKQHAGRKS